MEAKLCRSPADVEQLAVEMKAAAEKYSEEYCANRGKNLAEFGQWMLDVGLTSVIDIVKNGIEMHFSICLSKDDKTFTLSMLQMSEAGRATWYNSVYVVHKVKAMLITDGSGFKSLPAQ